MPKRDIHIKEYKNKSGERRFKFHLYLGLDENGKRVNITRQGFTNYNDAKTTYDKLKANGTQGYQQTKQVKTDELYSLWFNNYKGQVKESTANKTNQLYKNHIKPIFGSMYMDKIQVKTIQKYADDKAKEIVKYKDAVRILSRLYEYAMRLGYVNSNPTKRIIMPKKTTRPRRDIEHNVYSRKELELFLNAAKEYSKTAYTYFKLLSSTGVRRSEALALTWQDIDLKNQKLSVNKTLAYGLDGKIIMQSPKSKKSKRVLPISQNLTEVLFDYRKGQKVLYNKVFHQYDGTYYNLTAPGNWLYQIYKRNPKLKRITVHGFRHTFATLLISETDVKPKTVQMLMGHENIKMTMDIYTHLTKKNEDDAINSIRELNI